MIKKKIINVVCTIHILCIIGIASFVVRLKLHQTLNKNNHWKLFDAKLCMMRILAQGVFILKRRGYILLIPVYPGYDKTVSDITFIKSIICACVTLKYWKFNFYLSISLICTISFTLALYSHWWKQILNLSENVSSVMM